MSEINQQVQSSGDIQEPPAVPAAAEGPARSAAVAAAAGVAKGPGPGVTDAVVGTSGDNRRGQEATPMAGAGWFQIRRVSKNRQRR